VVVVVDLADAFDMLSFQRLERGGWLLEGVVAMLTKMR
jgi:hypothetical protein